MEKIKDKELEVVGTMFVTLILGCQIWEKCLSVFRFLYRYIFLNLTVNVFSIE